MKPTKDIIRRIIQEYRDRIPGGKADKRKPGDFDQKQLEMGIRVEREHTKDDNLAREIAMDHLEEDPLYYSHLIKMEKKYQK